MKLTRKFTAALVLGMFVVLAAYGVVRVRDDTREYIEDMQSHHRNLGHALGVSVREVWELDGQARALALIDRLNEQDGSLRIRWVWLDPQASEYYLPKAPLQQLLGVIRGNAAFWTDPRDNDAGRLYSYVPVRVINARAGALEMSESLTPLARHVHEQISAILVATGAMVVLSGLVAWVLGLWLVGRPIGALVEKARRVGAGDFSGSLPARRGDELGVLAVEMNSMSDRLSQAIDMVRAETQARLRALEQLRHADRLMTVGKLVSGIAHELGTPLNVVALRAKMVADGEEVGEEAQRSARIIGEQSARMATIIRQLLDFARPRRAAKGLIDLRDLARQTVNLLHPLADKRRVELRANTPTQAVPLECDANLLQQALTNLVVNGIAAMPEGGLLTVEVAHLQASPPTDQDSYPGPYASLRVNDAGSGIADENLPHLFDPFFTTKGVGEGTGLGLSVAYGMVREHGGWIDVQTQVGHGSQFTIYLPMSQPG